MYSYFSWNFSDTFGWLFFPQMVAWGVGAPDTFADEVLQLKPAVPTPDG